MLDSKLLSCLGYYTNLNKFQSISEKKWNIFFALSFNVSYFESQGHCKNDNYYQRWHKLWDESEAIDSRWTEGICSWRHSAPLPFDTVSITHPVIIQLGRAAGPQISNIYWTSNLRTSIYEQQKQVSITCWKAFNKNRVRNRELS